VSLVREGRTDDALEHLSAAIAKNPSHGEAQFLYGQLLNTRGRYAEAEKSLRSAEQNVAAGGDYLNQLAIALLEQNKLEEAEETAQNFLRAYPEDARARSLLGEIYLSRKQYEPARAQLIQALRTDPREPRAQIALGRTWLAIGKARNDAQDLAKAKQVLATAQGVDEGRRLLALGQVALAEGKLEDAGSLLQQATDRGAPELPVHLTLAETRWKANDLVGAAEELQRAAALAPGDPAVSLSLAITYFQLKDTTRAADQFLKAIQGIGLVTPPGEGAGPVVFPEPHVPLPDRFNVNRAIKDSVQAVLKGLPEDPTATQLKTLSESTTFLVGGPS
jgi:tetratricopeptide (TPR) repeat protein